MDRETIEFVAEAAKRVVTTYRGSLDQGALESALASAFEDFADQLLDYLPDEEPQP